MDTDNMPVPGHYGTGSILRAFVSFGSGLRENNGTSRSNGNFKGNLYREHPDAYVITVSFSPISQIPAMPPCRE